MKKYLLMCLSVLMIFPTSIYAEETLTEKNPENEVIEIEKANTLVVTLESCIDGDTARFRTSNDEVIKARFLAVDTPESVHPTIGEEEFGKEASEFTCNTLTEAKKIVIEYDAASDKKDNYGRHLVWVFVDDVLLQKSLVSNGYAEVAYLYGDYKYTSILQASEKMAKENKIGIWSIEEASEEVEPEQVTKDNSKDEENNFISKIVDMLFAKILDYINALLENILNYIEEML